MVKSTITWTLRRGEDTILASGGEGFFYSAIVYLFLGFTINDPDQPIEVCGHQFVTVL